MDTEIGAYLNQEVAKMFDVDKLFNVCGHFEETNQVGQTNQTS